MWPPQRELGRPEQPSFRLLYLRAGSVRSVWYVGSSVVLVALLAGCAATSPKQTRATAMQAAQNKGTDGLLGATSATLRSELGQPALVRHDGPAEVWLYRSPACTVDIILYTDGSTGGARVASVDARPLLAGAVGEGCLAGMKAPNGTGNLARRAF